MAINAWTHYESVADFLAVVQERVYIPQNQDTSKFDPWKGDSWDGAVDKATNGDLAAVPKAEAIIEAIDYEIDVAGLRPQWGSAVVGPYPNVPAFLAGHPESMRAMSMARCPRGPVTIYYSPVCSAVIDANDAHRRSLAVLSLVLALQRIRPVHVKLMTAYGHDSDHTIRIRTEPMVLAEAAHCLTATSFYRGLSYGLARTYGWGGQWAQWYSRAHGHGPTIEDEFRQRVGADPEDIIIPPMDSTHGAHGEMINSPAKWINRVLDKYRG